MNRLLKISPQKAAPVAVVLLAMVIFGFSSCSSKIQALGKDKGQMMVPLPPPRKTSELSVEGAIARRRSVRSYAHKPLSLTDVSQLLWAAQGITDPDTGKRAAPSAGMTYPLEVYLVVGSPGVEGLSKGVYHYIPERNSIKKLIKGNLQPQLADAALGQSWIEEAPIDIVLTGVYKRTTGKYGGRGIRYVHLEAGTAAQNLYLQAEALGLGMVAVGAFSDQKVGNLLTLSQKHTPLFIIPVGYPSGDLD